MPEGNSLFEVEKFETVACVADAVINIFDLDAIFSLEALNG